MIDYKKMFSLKGKTAIITGGSGLIGKEITTALAQAGAKCIILDINDKKSNELANGLRRRKLKVQYEKFDITDLAKIEENIIRLIKKYKKIDIWVNNAYPRTKDWGNKVEDVKLESFRKNVDMHLNSYSWICKVVALYMKKNGIKGVIINLSSIYGVLGNDFTVYEGTNLTSPMGYSAIKGGITNLTRYFSSYFGKDGIRINNICPGGIFNNQNPKFVKQYNSKVPLKRMGKPEDIASAIVFLSSDASNYITGATLMVDGGWSAI